MTAEEIKTLVNSPDYYNRYDKSKNWEYIALIVGVPTQAAEINELQSLIEDKICSVGKSLYDDGTIIDGCEIVLNATTQKATLQAGRIFLDGLVYNVAEKTLSLSETGSEAQIGVWKISSLLTSQEDSSLVNPAIGYPEYRSPGAFRILTKVQWGLSTETHSNAKFCGIYKISSGLISRIKRVKPDIIRYDKDAHGNYIVEGMNVSFVSSASGKQTFKVSKGLAHINGYETELLQDTALNINEVIPDESLTKEVTQSETLAEGIAKIALTHIPVEDVSFVLITKNRTVENLTHGSAGCVDKLPDESVIRVIEVKQGAKIYVEGTDFTFDSETDSIDWSLSEDEPTPNSKYDVTYEHKVNASFEFDNTSVMIADSDFLRDKSVDVVYKYRMPRKDIVIVQEDASVALLRGKANQDNPDNPVIPDVPQGAICLAEVTQTWISAPSVKNVTKNMREQIDELYSKIKKIEERLDVHI